MNFYKFLIFLFVFFLLWGQNPASSQNRPERSSLLVAPFKPHTAHHHLLKGFQQVIIDELSRITRESITERELINQYLKEYGSGKEPFTVYHTDVPDLAEQLNAEKVVLMDFNEKYGKVLIKISLMEGNTGNVIHREETKGVLGAFTRLEKDLLDTLLNILGFLGDPQIQKRASEGPKCLLEGVALLGKGLDYLDKGLLEKAAKYFYRATLLDSTLTSAQKQLSNVFKKAEEELIEPADIGMVYLKGKDIEKAKSYFTDALNQNSSDIKGLIGMGEIFLKEKEFEKASENLKLVLQFDKNNLDALILLAQIYKVQQKYPQAISLIERAAKINAANLSFNLVAGEVYEKAERKEDAVKYYTWVARFYKKELDVQNCLKYLEKIRQLDPEEVTPFLIEGDLKVSLGNYQGAVKVYKMGRDLAPDSDEIHQKLAFVYQQLGDTKKAREGFQKALALNPKNVNAYIGLGDISREEKKYDEAIKHYSQAKKIAPKNGEARIKLAETYKEAGKLNKASEEIEEVFDIGTGFSSPNLLKAHQLMADVLSKKGDFKKAKIHLEKAIEIDPDNVSAYEALGMVENALGEKEKAQNALEMAKLLGLKKPIKKPSLPKEKTEIISGLNVDFVQFIQTFPVNPPNETAPIAVNRDIMKPSFFSRFKAQIGFTREDWEVIYEDFTKALSVQYKLVTPTIIETTLAKKPFNQMSIKDLDDDNFMSLLCEALKAESIFFFRVESLESREEEKKFNIHGYLFDRSKRRWSGSITVTYPGKSLRKINWPFSIFFFLFLMGGLTYGYIYLRQGFGDLQVYIERDPKASAFFSVKVSKNPNVDLTKMKRSLNKGIEGRKYSRKAKFGSHTEKSMVEKECLFKKLHVGHYFVYLYGVILDSTNKQIGNYQLTKEVDIEKGKTSELTFDLMPKTAYVEIKVMEGELPARGAEISVKGKPGAKYIRDEQGVFFDLEPGRYVLLIHYKNKKFSKKISLPSIDNYEFTINLGGKV